MVRDHMPSLPLIFLLIVVPWTVGVSVAHTEDAAALPATTESTTDSTSESTTASTTASTTESAAEPRQPRIAAQADGTMLITFFDRSPHGQLEELSRRFCWSKKYGPEPVDYDLSSESFTVYMPPDYNPGETTHGLLIWLSPTANAGPPPEWWPVLDRHRLVWVGANDAGNQREVQWHRFALALDALYNMTRHFGFDERRVYASGFSGGGRAASHLAPHYADLIRGAVYICGASYFRDVANAKRHGFHFQPQFSRPTTPEIYNAACQRSRYVLLTGERDYNQVEIYSIFMNGYRRDPFKHVTYLEVPGMEHALPAPDWFEQAIRALDEPLADGGEK